MVQLATINSSFVVIILFTLLIYLFATKLNKYLF